MPDEELLECEIKEYKGKEKNEAFIRISLLKNLKIILLHHTLKTCHNLLKRQGLLPAMPKNEDAEFIQ